MMDQTEHYIMVAFLAIITLLTIVANFGMIYMIACMRKLREESKNYVILSLSVADGLIGLVLMPVGIAVYINDYILLDTDNSLSSVIHDDNFRVIWGILNVLCDDVSLLHLVFINVIKYHSVKNPLRFLIWMSNTKAVVISAMLWTGVSVTVTLLNFENIRDLIQHDKPDINTLRASQIGLMVLDGAFFAVIVSNILCFNVVRKLAYHKVLSTLQSSKHHSHLFDKQTKESKRTLCAWVSWRCSQIRATLAQAFRQRDVPIVKAAFNLCVQTTIFFICWFPQAMIYPLYLFRVLEGEASFTEKEYRQGSHFFLVSWFAWTNALMNPAIHIAFDRTMKEAIIRIIRQRRLNRNINTLDEGGYSRRTKCIVQSMIVEMATLIEDVENQDCDSQPSSKDTGTDRRDAGTEQRYNGTSLYTSTDQRGSQV